MGSEGGSNFIVVGSQASNGVQPTAGFLPKANAGETGKWHVLSVHWDVPSGRGGSSIWCNGKRLAIFQAKSVNGLNNLVIGDLDPSSRVGTSMAMAFFTVYKGKQMSDDVIKLHHDVLCSRYNVDYDPISYDLTLI